MTPEQRERAIEGMWSPCCQMFRSGGSWSVSAMHDGACRKKHGGTLGPTFRVTWTADYGAVIARADRPGVTP